MRIEKKNSAKLVHSFELIT